MTVKQFDRSPIGVLFLLLLPIQYYNALVPTTWNIPTMGPATEGFHSDWGAHVIRAYDPCLSCATHVMVVDDEDKTILKNDMVRI